MSESSNIWYFEDYLKHRSNVGIDKFISRDFVNLEDSIVIGNSYNIVNDKQKTYYNLKFDETTKDV